MGGGGGTQVQYQAPPPDNTFSQYLKYQQQKEAAAEKRAAQEKAEQKAAEEARKAGGAAGYAGLRSGIEQQLRQGLVSYEDATSRLRDYATKYDLTPTTQTDLSSYLTENPDLGSYFAETKAKQVKGKGPKQTQVDYLVKKGKYGTEADWLKKANVEYGTKATDLSQFSDEQLAKLHYKLYGEAQKLPGAKTVYTGPQPEKDVTELSRIYTEELLPGRRQTAIGAAYSDILGREATEEEKKSAMERFQQGYYTSNQDLRDTLYKGQEYQKKFNQSYLDNYYDTKFGKQTVDEKGERTGQRTFNFSSNLLPSFTGGTLARAGINTPDFGAITGTPAELEEQIQNVRDTRQFLYSAGLTNLQGEIDKETQKLKNEGSKELAKIQSQGSLYSNLVGAFNF